MTLLSALRGHGMGPPTLPYASVAPLLPLELDVASSLANVGGPVGDFGSDGVDGRRGAAKRTEVDG